MANMGAVRDALIKLMGAKKTVNRMGDIDVRPDDGTGGVMPTTGSELRGARQQAREVQGEDPLTQSWNEPLNLENPGGPTKGQAALGE